jgi:hypothetical protein
LKAAARLLQVAAAGHRRSRWRRARSAAAAATASDVGLDKVECLAHLHDGAVSVMSCVVAPQ